MLAKRSWSTDEVAKSDAAAYWASSLQHLMPGLRVESLARDFTAEMHQQVVGGLNVSLVRAAPQCIRSLPRPRSATDGQFALIYLRSGSLKVRQFARSLDLEPGQCVLLDGSQHSEVITRAPSETLNIVLPSRWVAQWLIRPENDVARPFTQANPRSRPFLGLLDLFASEEAAEVEGTLLLNQLGGALALAVGEQDVAGTPHAGRLLNRIQQIIWRRAGEAEFRPQCAADEIGISRRYLVSLCQAAGTTFNTELMRVRLEKGAEMLRDPRFEGLSVMEISLRCGFSDASHFSKRFKEKFSVPPAAYRAAQHPGNSNALLTVH